jgi:hypothetical protein
MAERQLEEKLRSENDPSYYRHCLGVSGFGDSEELSHEVESLRTKLATMDSPEELLALISDAANNDVRAAPAHRDSPPYQEVACPSDGSKIAELRLHRLLLS